MTTTAIQNGFCKPPQKAAGENFPQTGETNSRVINAIKEMYEQQMTHDTQTHIHEADPPAKQGTGCIFGKERWSQQEWARLKQLVERGYDRSAIALLMGRSKDQIKDKIRWETMSEEKRQERKSRIAAHLAKKKLEQPKRHKQAPVMSHRAPPATVLAERNTRLSAPQTLTGVLCGDPPIGFSALERRL